MCGITGIVSDGLKNQHQEAVESALKCLSKRGPDAGGIYTHHQVTLGHRRLAVIDLSPAGSQPMSDDSGRFTIVFNGEFFNYRQHRDLVLSKGFKLKSGSDTEVLLYLYIIEKEKCLNRINGFFSMAIYDNVENELFLARDRYGVKPLFYYSDNHRFVFASELKAIFPYQLPLSLDYDSLFAFFQLHYFQPSCSVFREIRKLKPGHYLRIKAQQPFNPVEVCWYSLPDKEWAGLSYQEACKELQKLTETAVERRLISDVPLGCFLSGGWDSSVVTALASRFTPHLKTFSIGFKDEPRFDETRYALAVSKMYKTDHTVFSLTNDDLFSVLFDVLNYMDEPFADSSALNVFILSRHTRREVTVALSGDGADELFLGYNKHRAEWMVRNRPLTTAFIKLLSPVIKRLSGSRNSRLANTLRQLNRFMEGASLDPPERYWRWCGFASEREIAALLAEQVQPGSPYFMRKQEITSLISGSKNLNDVFRADFALVLAGDMLTKVDMMSMANSLEVRNPFLDFELVNFVASLPSAFKTDRHSQKKILKDTFGHLLPEEVRYRGKQGFEVPLLKWCRTGLQPVIQELLDRAFIQEQGIFNADEVERIKTQLGSSHPGESASRLWALLVFQYWWKKYHSLFKS